MAFSLILILLANPRLGSKNAVFVLAFFILYALGDIFNNNNLYNAMQAEVMLFSSMIILLANVKIIKNIGKIIVIITCFLCFLMLVAYFYYSIFPDEFSSANFDIYSSETGSNRIYPSNLMDWISFTSGDGFDFYHRTYIRLKGYSNEPSSTIVHYFCPVVIALLLGKKYIYMSIFIIAVNIIAIASFTAIIIIGVATCIYLLIKYMKFKYSLVVKALIIFLIILLLNEELTLSIFEYIGEKLSDILGFDLVQRKIGNNLHDRQSGIINGIYMLFKFPIGYPSINLGDGAGLLYIVSSYTGYIGVIILGIFLYKNYINCEKQYEKYNLFNVRYAICLGTAIIVIALFVSGYGWFRPPGIIILLLFYRIFQKDFMEYILYSSNNS